MANLGAGLNVKFSFHFYDISLFRNYILNMEHLLHTLHTIKHPIEGCAYLVYGGAFVRWRFPKAWNKLLDRIAVKELSS